MKSSWFASSGLVVVALILNGGCVAELDDESGVGVTHQGAERVGSRWAPSGDAIELEDIEEVVDTPGEEAEVRAVEVDGDLPDVAEEPLEEEAVDDPASELERPDPTPWHAPTPEELGLVRLTHRSPR